MRTSSGDGPVFDQLEFRAALGNFASGITIVTAHVDDKPVGLAVQSFCSLSLDPPLVLFCPSRTSTSWSKIESVGKFCINVLSEEQEAHSRELGRSGDDKFANVPYELTSDTGSPRIIGAAAWLDCRTHEVHEGGDHFIVVGRVEALGAPKDVRPLTFWRGSYARLAHRPVLP